MTPHTQSFDWRVWAGQLVQFRRTGFGDSVPWLTLGTPREVLDGLDYCSTLRTQTQRQDLEGHWEQLPDGTKEWVWDVTDHQHVARAVDEHLAWWTGERRLLLEEMFSLLRYDCWWQCAPNAVIHWSMGPCVTAASDGVHVLLLSSATAPFSFMEVGRASVIGPVTSVPTTIEEWDYVGNVQRMTAAAPKVKSARQLLMESI